ncbi:MAG: hypothetical protein O7E52_14755 [Candidatus Poribacteria bacterium]|nr:hypothetical protein [Candidatus Poribacteria bacterium]
MILEGDEPTPDDPPRPFRRGEGTDISKAWQIGISRAEQRHETGYEGAGRDSRHGLLIKGRRSFVSEVEASNEYF